MIKAFMLTPAVYPRLVEFLHFDIQQLNLLFFKELCLLRKGKKRDVPKNNWSNLSKSFQ